MTKKIIRTDAAAAPGGPFSQAVVAGDHVYLAGAVPMRPDGSWVRGLFAEQARAVFTNLARVAEAAGADLAQAGPVGHHPWPPSGWGFTSAISRTSPR
jgi:enamine deaminase RidA (YjgF/YER057c/UK114 family)